MSLVGPRPERPEFVAALKRDISCYALLHFVKPGLAGWAQINYPYAASSSSLRPGDPFAFGHQAPGSILPMAKPRLRGSGDTPALYGLHVRSVSNMRSTCLAT